LSEGGRDRDHSAGSKPADAALGAEHARDALAEVERGERVPGALIEPANPEPGFLAFRLSALWLWRTDEIGTVDTARHALKLNQVRR
jgi:hypothetical protein